MGALLAVRSEVCSRLTFTALQCLRCTCTQLCSAIDHRIVLERTSPSEVFKNLLPNGFFGCFDKKGLFPFAHAIRASRETVLPPGWEALPEFVRVNGKLLFSEAARIGHKCLCEDLLASGVPLTSTGSRSKTMWDHELEHCDHPLLTSIDNGHCQVAIRLLELRADPNVRSALLDSRFQFGSGACALIHAVVAPELVGRCALVRSLLAHRASAKIRDGEGKTAIDYAQSLKRKAVAIELLQTRGDRNCFTFRPEHRRLGA